jgi:hypothetical protein
MKHLARVLAAFGILAALTSCGGDASPPKPAATSGSGPPPAQTSPAPPIAGPLLVYSLARPPDSPTPGWTIQTYDAGAGRTISSFDVGRDGELPQQAVLAGSRIAVNLNRRVVSYALDGSDPRDLRRTSGEGTEIVSIGASPDGTRIALTEQRAPLCPTPDASGRGMCGPYAAVTDIVVIDAADGHELLKVPQSAPGFDGYVGQAAVTAWRDDGRGFVVGGYTYSEYYGGVATVMLDGSVRQHDYRSWPYIAPNGRYIADGQWAPCSLSLATERHELRLRDIDGNQLLNETHEPVLNIEPAEWSPDGTEFLYRTYLLVPEPSQPPCKTADESTATWHVLRADGSPPSAAQDQYAARRRWSSDRYIEYRCAGVVVPQPYCMAQTGSAAPIDVYLGGQLVGSGQDLRVIGFVRP